MKKWTTLVLIVAIIMALFTLSGGKAGIYSYAELLDGMSDLYNYCQSDQHKEDDFSIFSFCILQNQNGISVYTDTVDEKDLTRIRQSVRIPEALEFVCNDT